MGRAPCCEKVGLKRGPWTPEEDEKLISFINEHGHGSWRALPKKAGLLRCGKSCRLRWTNYLRPDIKRGEFSASEEHAILQLHALLGNRWSAIASHLPKRTDNEIKNYWNTHLKKKLVKMGLDPVTHKPLLDSVLTSNSSGNTDKSSTSGVQQLGKLIGGSSSKSSIVSSGEAKASTNGKDSDSCQLLLRGASPLMKGSSVTMHLTQWESVRLEAEARLTQEAKMRAKGVWRRSENSPCAGGGPTASLFKGSSYFHDAVAGNKQSGVVALKAVSAMELMNALHNWEKSLQGQAGLLWPESWRVAATSTQHSCGHSESSSSSSPPSTAEAAPTSSTSLDCRRKATECITTTPDHPQYSPPRKLSWSDALMPPKLPLPHPHDFCKLEGPCRGGSFSSLMLDAVLGRSLVQGFHGPCEVEADGPAEAGSSDHAKLKTAAADHSTDKTHLDEASNASAVTGDVQHEACTDDDDNDDDDDDERSLSVDGTSDLFKDLPRLQRDATTTPVSYTALLSEEISDYWSNIVLKEQVSSPTIHISF